ncbi:MAG: hypothetical protein MJD61_04140 [Proteobacteria bacterium]|nr:hypothetical protein [Pseudomonadota bacterium]
MLRLQNASRLVKASVRCLVSRGIALTLAVTMHGAVVEAQAFQPVVCPRCGIDPPQNVQWDVSMSGVTSGLERHNGNGTFAYYQNNESDKRKIVANSEANAFVLNITHFHTIF